jgi:4-hydroxybenzoate polyprenyltransferase
MVLLMISTAVMVVTLATYAALALWALGKRRPVWGGLLMMVVAVMPLVWQGLFTDSDAPGFAILTVLLLLAALGFVVTGVIGSTIKRLARRTEKA